jgi:predicted acetyltransferase
METTHISPFLDPGQLIDDDLELLLVDRYPGDSAINFVPSYRFDMSLVTSGARCGQIELRIGSTHGIVMYGGHIGYDVSEEHRGKRYAARSCSLLLPLAKRHDLNPLWITSNPDNLPSRRTCEIIGARLIEIVDLPKETDLYQEGDRQKCRYRLDL